MTSSRRMARRRALQALYEWDAVGHDPSHAVGLAAGGKNTDGSAYARELVQQVLDHTAEVDDLIRRFAPAWPLDQIAIVDRNILRIALCELLFREDVPAKVVVNEAVEVAKSYGGDGSSRFINGVLGSFLGQVAKTA